MFKPFPMKRELLIKQGVYCDLDGAPLGLYHTMTALRTWFLRLSENVGDEIRHYKVTIRAEPVMEPRSVPNVESG